MPYENQTIGIFLYTLGVVAGRRGKDISDCINLFQQTPGDKAFNDLLLRWQGKHFIIEFKRNEAALDTEIAKPKRVKLINGIQGRDNDLRDISLQSHWIGYAVEQNAESSLTFKRYVRFKALDEDPIQFQNYISLLSDPNSEVGITDANKFEKYLKYLIEISDGSAVTGLMVNAAADGSFNFIIYNSYEQLNQYVKLAATKAISKSNENMKRVNKGPRLSS